MTLKAKGPQQIEFDPPELVCRNGPGVALDLDRARPTSAPYRHHLHARATFGTSCLVSFTLGDTLNRRRTHHIGCLVHPRKRYSTEVPALPRPHTAPPARKRTGTKRAPARSQGLCAAIVYRTGRTRPAKESGRSSSAECSWIHSYQTMPGQASRAWPSWRSILSRRCLTHTVRHCGPSTEAEPAATTCANCSLTSHKKRPVTQPGIDAAGSCARGPKTH